MLGFINKLFSLVQLIVFLDHVLLLAELAKNFKSFPNSCMAKWFHETELWGIYLYRHLISKYHFGLQKKESPHGIMSTAKWIWDWYFLHYVQCMTILIYAKMWTSTWNCFCYKNQNKRNFRFRFRKAHNSYKARKKSNKLLYCFGKNEENIYLSRIHLPVKVYILLSNSASLNSKTEVTLLEVGVMEQQKTAKLPCRAQTRKIST